MTVLQEIQSELKAPKNQRNSFGNYNYRSCEDILEAVKPLLKEKNATLTLSDDVVWVWDRVYVKATATLKAKDEVEVVTGYAREALTKKWMDDSQITWAASSYARKYALNWLFAIDDTKDADTDEKAIETKARAKKVKDEPLPKFTKDNFDKVKWFVDEWKPFTLDMVKKKYALTDKDIKELSVIWVK